MGHVCVCVCLRVSVCECVYSLCDYCKVIRAHHSGAYSFSLRMMTGAQNKDGGPLIPHHKLRLIQSVCVCVCVSLCVCVIAYVCLRKSS